MKKTFSLHKQTFESASNKTPQYLTFHRTFKREFKAFLESIGASAVEIGKPNHFDASGFFTIDNQIWYFSIGDLRWFKDTMLVRTAAHYKDWTGGANQTVSMRDEETFIKDLTYLIKE